MSWRLGYSFGGVLGGVPGAFSVAHLTALTKQIVACALQPFTQFYIFSGATFAIVMVTT